MLSRNCLSTICIRNYLVCIRNYLAPVILYNYTCCTDYLLSSLALSTTSNKYILPWAPWLHTFLPWLVQRLPLLVADKSKDTSPWTMLTPNDARPVIPTFKKFKSVDISGYLHTLDCMVTIVKPQQYCLSRHKWYKIACTQGRNYPEIRPLGTVHRLTSARVLYKTGDGKKPVRDEVLIGTPPTKKPALWNFSMPRYWNGRGKGGAYSDK